MPAPAVAVVVVSWNTRELLGRCLESLDGEVQAGRARVVVVDNASGDGSPELVRERFPWAELIASPENLGFGRAVNLGARELGHDAAWIAPANADVALEPGALAALLAAGDADPGAGILAPRLIRPDGSTQQSLHQFPTVGFTAAFNAGRGGRDRRWAAENCLDGAWDPDLGRRVPWAEGAFLLVRRGAWEAVGGFDEGRFMYAEDLDLGWRAARAGWATRYVPQARVHHELSAATTQAWGEERTLRWVRETYRWIAQRRGRAAAAAVGALNLAGAGVRALRTGPDGRMHRGWTRVHARALRDILRA